VSVRAVCMQCLVVDKLYEVSAHPSTPSHPTKPHPHSFPCAIAQSGWQQSARELREAQGEAAAAAAAKASEHVQQQQHRKEALEHTASAPGLGAIGTAQELEACKLELVKAKADLEAAQAQLRALRAQWAELDAQVGGWGVRGSSCKKVRVWSRVWV